MPAPPTEVRIKRKATDDPVELLHVQNDYNGLRQIKQYIFKRQRTSNLSKSIIVHPLNTSSLLTQQPSVSFAGDKNIIKTPQPSESLTGNGRSLDNTPGLSVGTLLNSRTTLGTERTSDGNGEILSVTANAPPRRFHLSRNSIGNTTGTIQDNARGSRGSSAVFVERTPTIETSPKVADASIHPKPVSISYSASDIQDTDDSSNAQLSAKVDQARPAAPLRNVRLSSGKVMPWNADSVTLAAEMQAYTLQEIGHNLSTPSTTEIPIMSTPTIRARQVSSFKPRTTAFRQRERNLEQISPSKDEDKHGHDEIMTDALEPNGNEADYVMDIYIRLPAEMIELEEQKSIGLLVLDSQPDIDEFYNDGSDSESEPYDEEEDENAENHPSTDYPEDEIESDDEYGRNPYQLYRNSNASDNDEFDENDSTYSDNEVKPPWARKPWMSTNAYGNDDQHHEDDD